MFGWWAPLAQPDVSEEQALQPCGADASAMEMNCLRYGEQHPGNSLQRRERISFRARLLQEALACFGIRSIPIASDNSRLLE